MQFTGEARPAPRPRGAAAVSFPRRAISSRSRGGGTFLTMGTALEIGIIILLVLLNGAFAMSELAIVSSRRSRAA